METEFALQTAVDLQHPGVGAEVCEGPVEQVFLAYQSTRAVEIGVTAFLVVPGAVAESRGIVADIGAAGLVSRTRAAVEGAGLAFPVARVGLRQGKPRCEQRE